MQITLVYENGYIAATMDDDVLSKALMLNGGDFIDILLFIY